MRTIIRFSLNADNGTLTVRLGNILKRGGFVKPQSTATYEHPNIGPRKLGHILREFWIAVSVHQGRAHIDHFWMYSDQDRSPPRRRMSN
jgi:hypothetical protein